jgi:PLP dependent protein
MLKVAQNLAFVRKTIESTALKYKRDPKEITLVAVSKNASFDQVRAAYENGCKCFGESRMQDALEKIPFFPSEISWHFIGSLQKNKVSKAINHFALVHSVDSMELAKLIAEKSRLQNLCTSVLIQINTSQESTKHGFTAEMFKIIFSELWELKGIRIEGLMTIAPQSADQEKIKNSFVSLRLLRDELRTKMQDSKILHHLSMGMSQDYPLAIAEGATLLRVGSAIFN